jgi:hypothetical protein
MDRETGRPRAVRRSRAGAFLGVITLALLVSDCSDDPTGSGSGGLTLDLHMPSGRGAADESLSVWIEDLRGDLLAGPTRVAFGGEENSFDLALDVPEGNGRRVWASVEAAGWGGRGFTALGSRGGIRVRAATVTEVTVDLDDVVPRLSEVAARPGDLQYRVHWTRVAGADRYELHERIGDDPAVYMTPDTSRAFALTPGAAAIYRVRAHLGSRTSIYTDSVVVDRAGLADLPRIVAVVPSD